MSWLDDVVLEAQVTIDTNEVAEALRSMVLHAHKFPKHGINCACKDSFIKQAKQTSEEVRAALRYLGSLMR